MNPKLFALSLLVASLLVTSCRTTDSSSISVSELPTTTAGNSTAPDGPYSAARNPRADIEAALAASAKDGKLVIVDFGANWCPDCLVLDKLYHDPTVEPTLTASFRVVPVDVGEFDRNMDLSDEYGRVTKGGIPALVLLHPDGSVKSDTRMGEFANARTMTAPQLLEHLRQFLS